MTGGGSDRTLLGVRSCFIEEHDDVLAEGYTTTDQHEQAADSHWVCPQCAADFAEEFGMRVADAIELGPNAAAIR
jgi:hypothetical protein